MIRSILMGVIAGSRSMTPMAVVTRAARTGTLPANDSLTQFLATDLARAGAYTMAVGELAGDKMKSAPDRVVVLGMIARFASAGIAGAALARPKRRAAAAGAAIAVAMGSAYATWGLRCRAMDRYGQTKTGLVEDAMAVAGAVAIANVGASRKAGTQSG